MGDQFSEWNRPSGSKIASVWLTGICTQEGVLDEVGDKSNMAPNFLCLHVATFVELFAKKVTIMMSSLRTVRTFSGIFAGQILIFRQLKCIFTL